jgi:hypothetical protein
MVARDGIEPPTPAFSDVRLDVLPTTYRRFEGLPSTPKTYEMGENLGEEYGCLIREFWRNESFSISNFARVHQTLRVTPCMEAGLSDHVWSTEEICNLVAPKKAVSRLRETERQCC